MKYLIYILSFLPIWLSAQPGADKNMREIWSGYIAYEDTTTAAVTVVAGDTITLYLSPDFVERRNRIPFVDSLYSRTDTAIIGDFGNAYNGVYELEITQNTNNDTRTSVWIDIGGGIPPLYVQSFFLTRGSGQTSVVNKSTGIYTLDTWQANGGKLKFTTDQSVDVHFNRLILYLLHKGFGVPLSN